MSVAEAFEAAYGRAPVGVWSAPGRVNLIGEHTDYNDGFVLPFAIAARTYVAAAARADGILRVRSVQQPDEVLVPLDEVTPGQGLGWGAYVAGMLWATRLEGHHVDGLDVFVDGRVPLGSGLSSSHALQCAVGLAVDEIHGLGMARLDVARLARISENQFVGAPTGMMDQVASLLATRDNALFVDMRSLVVEQVPLPVADAGLTLLVVNTRVHHGNAEGAYGRRRSVCEDAAKLLGVTALRDVTDLDDALERLGDEEQRQRVRHVVSENARVLDTVAALRAGDWTTVGGLMTASHASLRDDYEVSCAELDCSVETLLAHGAVGARMTGGGFGGSAIALLPAGDVEACTTAVRAAFAAHGWAAPDPFPVTPSDGARRDS